jgi:hypothetical protein
MKKIIAITSLVAATSASAFFGNNNNGYQEDNGMFGYNPYDYWDPRWYMEEMSNMVLLLKYDFVGWR